jgi:hypothetical protein
MKFSIGVNNGEWVPENIRLHSLNSSYPDNYPISQQQNYLKTWIRLYE